MQVKSPTWKRNFIQIVAGQGVSDFSSSLVSFALIWSLVQTTNSPLVLSFALMAEFFPGAIIGPIAGAIIDRYSRKKIMILADVFISLVGIAFVILEGFISAPAWILIAVIALRSVGASFQRPCLQAIVPQIVPKEHLFRCAGVSQTIQSLSRLASPGAAAGLFLIWNISNFVLLDIVGAVVAIVLLVFAKIPLLEKKEEKKTSYLKDIGDGLQMLRQNKGMLGVVLIGALYAFALTPVSALFPLMSLDFFGGTSIEAGLVEMFFAGGSLLGALLLSITGGFKNKINNIIAVIFLMTGCLILSGLLSPSGLIIFMGVALLMGVCAPNFYGSQTALLQQSFPPEYMGRIMALTAGIRFITSPFSLLLYGLLSEAFGLQIWFIIGGSLTFICALLCLSITSIRRCGKVGT